MEIKSRTGKNSAFFFPWGGCVTNLLQSHTLQVLVHFLEVALIDRNVAEAEILPNTSAIFDERQRVPELS